MTPIGGRGHNDQQRNYKVSHKHIRNVIEKLNGVLKSRFRCCFSESSLHYWPDRAARIINACAILYDLCMTRQDIPPEDPVENQNIEDHENEIDANIEITTFTTKGKERNKEYLIGIFKCDIIVLIVEQLYKLTLLQLLRKYG